MDCGCLLPHFTAVCPALLVASGIKAIKSEEGRYVEVRLTFRLCGFVLGHQFHFGEFTLDQCSKA